MAQLSSIRIALQAQPFRPFDLKLVDGSTYKVKHPDYLIIPPIKRPREAIFFTEGSEDEYDAHYIDLGLINEIIVPGAGTRIEPPTSPTEDGE